MSSRMATSSTASNTSARRHAETTPTTARGADATRPRAARRRFGGLLGPKEPVSASAVTRDLVAYARLELVPMKSLDHAVAALPPASRLSVTCSPVKGIGATLDVTARLRDFGHDVVPHLSARLVESPRHVATIATWLRDHDVPEVFIVAGDAASPAGPYEGAHAFIRELFEHDPRVTRVGVAAYPDGHSLIHRNDLHEALHAKQQLLAEIGVGGTATTQMCFDPRRIRDWLVAERNAGLTMPVHLGIPGVVDRTKLMTMGARLGIGASLRYLKKNRSSMKRMLAPGGYDPTDLLESLAGDAYPLGITGLHSFTFNNVADTLRWQRAVIG